MESIAPVYTVFLRDWNFNVVAIFDVFSSLSYGLELNGIGTYSFVLNARDSRVDLFNLDYFVDIQRSVPGCGVPPYREFFGIHRKPSFSVSQTGEQVFTSTGVGLNYFLQGASINYPAGTTRSYKECSSNRAILEYVEENRGESATVAEERLFDAVLPNLVIDPVTEYGPLWEGERASENLLDVISDIAKFSDIDFSMEFDPDLKKLRFRTFTSGIGSNRTNIGISNSTGRNSFGNFPQIFSLEAGNVASLEYDYNRISEGNVVSVLGDGDGATRQIQVRESPRRLDSPYNLRELSRSYSGFINESQVYGDEVLSDQKAKEIISIDPLLQPSSMYGKHFFLGDWITTFFRGVERHRRIISIKNTVGPAEKIALEFAEP